MQDNQQFEQLMLLYNQLKNGSIEISKMIDDENLDSAITMLSSRESIINTCKNIRRYLEFTPAQKEEVDKIVEEIKVLEEQNIEKIRIGMENIQLEIRKSQQTQKIRQAYDVDNEEESEILNIKEDFS